MANKTSVLIPFQLPEYIRDNPDYSKFVAFLQAYYQWMEQTGQVTDTSKNLLNYADVDKTTEEFLKYYINDFLPYFPDDALISKEKALKFAKELYQSKGTIASYQFLFRILYNSDFDVFYTKDAVLRASSGNWYIPKSIQLDTLDTRLLSLSNYCLFGETSKSFAVVENAVINNGKIQIYISNIERQFQSGEWIRVVDNYNQDILVNGTNIRAKIAGQISQINIAQDSAGNKLRGTSYQSGDPVVVYGGLTSPTGIGATANVGQVTSGSVTQITINSGGFGYSKSPNTEMVFTNVTTGAEKPSAIVADVNTLNSANIANVSMICNTSLSTIVNTSTTIGGTYSAFTLHPTANANTSLANALNFISFTTYPISSVLVTDGGNGMTIAPTVTADSEYQTNSAFAGHLKSLGILAPIQISNGGKGYRANDVIVFTGGSGYGARANVTSVDANGSIASINYVFYSNDIPHHYPLGGMGYKPDALPTLTISSANTQASNASVYVPGILGDGATFTTSVDRAGSITTINVIRNGEDYITTPNVSLKVQDILVTNNDINFPPQSLDIIYQGDSYDAATYIATVDSLLSDPVQRNNPSTTSIYRLRVYDYTSQPDITKPLKFTNKTHTLNMYGSAFTPDYNSSGVKNYGDGTARAVATFLNGLVIGTGSYLDTKGQLSGFDVIQSTDYNNYTYQITVEKEISKYRETLLSLLHPAGLKLIGRYAAKSNTSYENSASNPELSQGYTLSHYTGYPASSASIVTNFVNKSNNIITFNNLAGANIAEFIFTSSSGNSFIEIIGTPNVRSEITNVDYAHNRITIKDNVWLTFANVAHATAIAGKSVINISSLTGLYDIVNNGNYSNTANPLSDIIHVGDNVLLDNNTFRTVSSIAANNLITVSSPFTSNASSLMAVSRNYVSTDIQIYGPAGVQSFPQLGDEAGNIIIAQNGVILLLG